MPHVDEGEMHALLDGAYAHDAPDAARIREEIATCAECHARFAEAQALRMRASAVLDRALPRPSAPPFESIVERVGAVDAPRPFRFPAGAPLAWAATIVLALGLGWFGRDWLRSPPPTSRVAERAADTGVSRVSPQQTQPMTAQMETLAAPPAAAPSPTPSGQRAQLGSRRVEPLADVAGAAASSANRAGARRDDAVAKAAAGRTANAPENAAFARDSVSRSAEQARQRAAAAPPPPARAAVPAERMLASSALAQDASAQWAYGTIEEAERTTGRRVLIVHGLAVENVGVARIDGRYVTRVTQRLPDGNLIEIVQELAPETDRALELREEVRAAAPQPPGKDELGVTVLKVARVGWVLTGRSTLSQDSLRVLLNSAR
jgi:hypothetical protein